jgi:hypothetical protein
VEDQFPFRTAWIQVKSLSDRILGKTESNGIFLAKKGYLIENFTEPDADRYAELIETLDDFVGTHGTLKQYMLIAPTAVNIYADKLPLFAVAGDQDAYLDQLKDDALNAGITFIDVRDAFREATDTQLFYKTDHHWTTDGAYVAFQQFAEKAGLDISGTSYDRLQVTNSFSGTMTASSGFRMAETENIYVYLPQNGVDYTVNYVSEAETTASFYDSANLSIRDKYTVFMNGNHPLVKIQTTANSGRTLLVLKDSYANCFVPFLAEYYDKILVVDPRYYYDDLENLITSENVTEVLYLYNANGFAEDTSLVTVIGEDASSTADADVDTDTDTGTADE